MIVIAIIGILAAIAIPQFGFYRKRSYNASAVSYINTAATAQEAYYVDYATYTGTIGNLVGTYGLYTSKGVAFQNVSGATSTYHLESYHTSGNITYRLTGPGGSIGH